MPKIDHDTKEKILAAAEKVFHANGFKGTRTTLIAEEAGISRTMLHYYFSTKESLFSEVLQNTISTVLNHLKKIINSDIELEALIENLVDVISDLIEEKPGLPSFIINILNESPQMAYVLAHSNQDTVPFELNEILKIAKQEGKITQNINGEDLIMNIYGLCAMPYLAHSYIKVMENRTDEDMKTFIRERRVKIKELILKGIKP
jgi:TetR/AcrR family transcriptional regulator